MSLEMFFSGTIYLGVFGFLGWIFWVTDEKHPKRLAKLRREFGVNDKPD